MPTKSRRKTRDPLMIANWKAFGSTDEMSTFIGKLAADKHVSSENLYLAFPYHSLKAFSEQFPQSGVIFGANEMTSVAEGTFTQSVAASVISEAGGTFVLIGTAIQRTFFGESNESVNAKIKLALAKRLTPVVCIGETLDQYREGSTESALKEQLEASLKDLSQEQLEIVIIAYEAPWIFISPKDTLNEDLKKGVEICRKVIQETIGMADMPLICSIPVEIRDFSALIKDTDADGFYFGQAAISLDLVNLYSETMVKYEPGAKPLPPKEAKPVDAFEEPIQEEPIKAKEAAVVITPKAEEAEIASFVSEEEPAPVAKETTKKKAPKPSKEKKPEEVGVASEPPLKEEDYTETGISTESPPVAEETIKEEAPKEEKKTKRRGKAPKEEAVAEAEVKEEAVAEAPIKEKPGFKKRKVSAAEQKALEKELMAEMAQGKTGTGGLEGIEEEAPAKDAGAAPEVAEEAPAQEKETEKPAKEEKEAVPSPKEEAKILPKEPKLDAEGRRTHEVSNISEFVADEESSEEEEAEEEE